MEDIELKKGTKFKDWIIFLAYAGFAMLCFYYNIWWGGFGSGAMATYAFPNARFRVWLHKKGQEGLELAKGLLWLGLGLLIIAGVIWLFSSVFNGIGGFGKYEGQTAEEWFNYYDEAEAKYQRLHDCVEPYATANRYISADDLYYECF